MCPEPQLLSIFFDNELPSPWKEKLELHLESCPACRAVLGAYNFIGENLEAPPAETMEAVRDRVWKKLAGAVPAGGYLRARQTGPVNRAWNRSISLPLPALAAAAVIIVVCFFALLGIRSGIAPQSTGSMVMANIGLDDEGIVPVADMNGVLKYLSSQDANDVMVIRLPESRRFSRAGEPALINAADYSRTRRNISP
jgi:hypothetical protein